MVKEGTVKSTSNIALAALFWSLSSMIEEQLSVVKLFSILKKEGGDEKNEWLCRTDKSRTLKK